MEPVNSKRKWKRSVPAAKPMENVVFGQAMPFKIGPRVTKLVIDAVKIKKNILAAGMECEMAGDEE
jgi:hypothetical protein